MSEPLRSQLDEGVAGLPRGGDSPSRDRGGETDEMGGGLGRDPTIFTKPPPPPRAEIDVTDTPRASGSAVSTSMGGGLDYVDELSPLKGPTVGEGGGTLPAVVLHKPPSSRTLLRSSRGRRYGWSSASSGGRGLSSPSKASPAAQTILSENLDYTPASWQQSSDPELHEEVLTETGDTASLTYASSLTSRYHQSSSTITSSGRMLRGSASTLHTHHTASARTMSTSARTMSRTSGGSSTRSSGGSGLAKSFRLDQEKIPGGSVREQTVRKSMEKIRKRQAMRNRAGNRRGGSAYEIDPPRPIFQFRSKRDESVRSLVSSADSGAGGSEIMTGGGATATMGGGGGRVSPSSSSGRVIRRAGSNLALEDQIWMGIDALLQETFTSSSGSSSSSSTSGHEQRDLNNILPEPLRRAMSGHGSSSRRNLQRSQSSRRGFATTDILETAVAREGFVSSSATGIGGVSQESPDETIRISNLKAADAASAAAADNGLTEEDEIAMAKAALKSFADHMKPASPSRRGERRSGMSKRRDDRRGVGATGEEKDKDDEEEEDAEIALLQRNLRSLSSGNIAPEEFMDSMPSLQTFSYREGDGTEGGEDVSFLEGMDLVGEGSSMDPEVMSYVALHSFMDGLLSGLEKDLRDIEVLDDDDEGDDDERRRRAALRTEAALTLFELFRWSLSVNIDAELKRKSLEWRRRRQAKFDRWRRQQEERDRSLERLDSSSTADREEEEGMPTLVTLSDGKETGPSDGSDVSGKPRGQPRGSDDDGGGPSQEFFYPRTPSHIGGSDEGQSRHQSVDDSMPPPCSAASTSSSTSSSPPRAPSPDSSSSPQPTSVEHVWNAIGGLPMVGRQGPPPRPPGETPPVSSSTTTTTSSGDVVEIRMAAPVLISSEEKGGDERRRMSVTDVLPDSFRGGRFDDDDDEVEEEKELGVVGVASRPKEMGDASTPADDDGADADKQKQRSGRQDEEQEKEQDRRIAGAKLTGQRWATFGGDRHSGVVGVDSPGWTEIEAEEEMPPPSRRRPLSRGGEVVQSRRSSRRRSSGTMQPWATIGGLPIVMTGGNGSSVFHTGQFDDDEDSEVADDINRTVEKAEGRTADRSESDGTSNPLPNSFYGQSIHLSSSSGRTTLSSLGPTVGRMMPRADSPDDAAAAGRGVRAVPPPQKRTTTLRDDDNNGAATAAAPPPSRGRGILRSTSSRRDVGNENPRPSSWRHYPGSRHLRTEQQGGAGEGDGGSLSVPTTERGSLSENTSRTEFSIDSRGLVIPKKVSMTPSEKGRFEDSGKTEGDFSSETFQYKDQEDEKDPDRGEEVRSEARSRRGYEESEGGGYREAGRPSLAPHQRHAESTTSAATSTKSALETLASAIANVVDSDAAATSAAPRSSLHESTTGADEAVLSLPTETSDNNNDNAAAPRLGIAHVAPSPSSSRRSSVLRSQLSRRRTNLDYVIQSIEAVRALAEKTSMATDTDQSGTTVTTNDIESPDEYANGGNGGGGTGDSQIPIPGDGMISRNASSRSSRTPQPVRLLLEEGADLLEDDLDENEASVDRTGRGIVQKRTKRGDSYFVAHIANSGDLADDLDSRREKDDTVGGGSSASAGGGSGTLLQTDALFEVIEQWEDVVVETKREDADTAMAPEMSAAAPVPLTSLRRNRSIDLVRRSPASLHKLTRPDDTITVMPTEDDFSLDRFTPDFMDCLHSTPPLHHNDEGQGGGGAGFSPTVHDLSSSRRKTPDRAHRDNDVGADKYGAGSSGEYPPKGGGGGGQTGLYKSLASTVRKAGWHVIRVIRRSGSGVGSSNAPSPSASMHRRGEGGGGSGHYDNIAQMMSSHDQRLEEGGGGRSVAPIREGSRGTDVSSLSGGGSETLLLGGHEGAYDRSHVMLSRLIDIDEHGFMVTA